MRFRFVYRKAYKRFKHVPLYLEWAPNGIFAGKKPAAAADKAVAATVTGASPPFFLTEECATAATCFRLIYKR